jgi:hypothetical protein
VEQIVVGLVRKIRTLPRGRCRTEVITSRLSKQHLKIGEIDYFVSLEKMDCSRKKYSSGTTRFISGFYKHLAYYRKIAESTD